jgi:MerR family mercuric resistance operon transcriptional regulator
MTETQMTIGSLAQAAGVNVETIRYYQRIGLLATPHRSHGSFRRYPEESLKRLCFIKRAQQLGFTLDEVAVLLDLSDGAHCEETRALAERKLALVERKLADLAAIRDVLDELITACRHRSSATGCSIIDKFAGSDHSGTLTQPNVSGQSCPEPCGRTSFDQIRSRRICPRGRGGFEIGEREDKDAATFTLKPTTIRSIPA